MIRGSIPYGMVYPDSSRRNGEGRFGRWIRGYVSVAVVALNLLFGVFFRGDFLNRVKGGIEVIPRDGIREGFHFLTGDKGNRLPTAAEEDFPASRGLVFTADGPRRIKFTL